MKHADAVIARILFLEGVPNMQRYFPVKVGEDADRAAQARPGARARRREAPERGHRHVPRQGRQRHPRAARVDPRKEEEGIDWLEAQLYLIKSVGKEAYLSEQMGGN